MHAKLETRQLTGQHCEQKDVIRECDEARTSQLIEYAVLIKGKLQLHVHILIGEAEKTQHYVPISDATN
jgi:hypothetical protein